MPREGCPRRWIYRSVFLCYNFRGRLVVNNFRWVFLNYFARERFKKDSTRLLTIFPKRHFVLGDTSKNIFEVSSSEVG